MALIGVAAIVTFIIGRVNVFLDDTDEKKDYERLYATLVSLDPVAFTSIENADQNTLRLVSVMTALQMQNTDLYETDRMWRLLLPAIDVERYAGRLFGPNFRLAHETFGGSGRTNDDGIDYSAYIYVPEKQAYSVPPTSLAGSFIPQVIKIERSGNTKVLTVAYMLGSSSVSDVLTDPDALRISKYMEYVLIKEGSDFYLYSIRESSYQPS